MTHSLLRGALTAISLLALSLPSCTRPVPSDQRPTATPRGRGGVQPDAKRYPVRFGRPLKVGERYRIELHGNVDNETTMDGQPAAARTDRWSYYLLSEATVKAIHACGKATREEHRVLKLQLTRSGTTVDLLPA